MARQPHLPKDAPLSPKPGQYVRADIFGRIRVISDGFLSAGAGRVYRVQQDGSFEYLPSA